MEQNGRRATVLKGVIALAAVLASASVAQTASPIADAAMKGDTTAVRQLIQDRVDVNAAWDLATHDISVANYWLDAEPVTASAVGGSWINPGIEDAVDRKSVV